MSTLWSGVPSARDTWHPDISALILAGGRATRLGGVSKHALVVDAADGRTIFERQVALLRPRVAEVIVSLRAGPDIAGFRTVSDHVFDVGPLAGIAAGLSGCRTTWLLVVAGDMPHLTDSLIDRMLQRAEDANDERDRQTEAVGVRSRGLPEPLLCVLRTRVVLPIVAARIASGRYKASGLLTDEGLRVAWIDDADPAALRNVNSPEDL